MKRMGLIVSSLGPNQIAYQSITSANYLLSKRDDIDFSIFYKQLAPYVIPTKFATYHFAEVFNFDGDIICTDIFSAARIVNYPGPRKNRIYLYEGELDWLRVPNQNQSYSQLKNIYNNEYINLIARSKSYFDILSLWKQPISIVENFNMYEFAKLIYPEMFNAN